MGQISRETGLLTKSMSDRTMLVAQAQARRDAAVMAARSAGEGGVGTAGMAQYEAAAGVRSTVRVDPASTVLSGLRNLQAQAASRGFGPANLAEESAEIERLARRSLDPRLSDDEVADALTAANQRLASLRGRAKGQAESAGLEARGQRRVAAGTKFTFRVENIARNINAAANVLGETPDIQDLRNMHQELQNLGAGDVAARAELEGGIASVLRDLQPEVARLTPASRRQVGAIRASQRRTGRDIADFEDYLRGEAKPGGRIPIRLTAEQSEAFRRIRAQHEALGQTLTGQGLTAEQLEDAQVAQQDNTEQLKALTHAVQRNTKETADQAKLRKEFENRDALAIGMTVRSLGGRAASFGAGFAGLTGDQVAPYAATKGLDFATGAFQDYALNKFITDPTRGSLGMLIGATAASAVSNVFGAFAQRGLQNRAEATARVNERLGGMSSVLAGTSMFSDIYGTSGGISALGNLKVGTEVGYDLLRTLNAPLASGISIGSTPGTYAADLLREGLAVGTGFTPYERSLVEKKIGYLDPALIRFGSDANRRDYKLTIENEAELSALRLGARLKFIDKEKERITDIENAARKLYSYGGLVNIDEMTRSSASIGAQGIPIRALARSITPAGTDADEIPFIRKLKRKLYGDFGSGYQEGVSELGIGAYATSISKLGLDQKSVEAAIAMQGMGMAGAGFGYGPNGLYSSRALDTFAYAVQTGMPASLASQVLGTGLSMSREGMFTDLTALAERTRGLSMSGITPGTIGMVQSGMMQTRRGTLGTLTAPLNQLNQGMALVYALEKSGGDYFGAIEAIRSGKVDTGSADYLSYMQSQIGTELGGGILQAQGARLGDVSKFFGANAAPLKQGERASVPLLSALVQSSIDAVSAARKEEGVLKPSEQAGRAYTEATLDNIAASMARTADYLGQLVGSIF
jgi:hypothetical protein